MVRDRGQRRSVCHRGAVSARHRLPAVRDGDHVAGRTSLVVWNLSAMVHCYDGDAARADEGAARHVAPRCLAPRTDQDRGLSTQHPADHRRQLRHGVAPAPEDEGRHGPGRAGQAQWRDRVRRDLRGRRRPRSARAISREEVTGGGGVRGGLTNRYGKNPTRPVA